VNALRWILALVLAPVGYVAAFVMAGLLVQLMSRFCPAELQVSGVCTASWYPVAEMISLAVATAIGAAVWVVLPVLVAPAHRSKVAWVAFASGTALAVWFVSQFGSEFALPFASALIGGSTAALITASRNKRAT
jgi:hypothetical protein